MKTLLILTGICGSMLMASNAEAKRNCNQSENQQADVFCKNRNRTLVSCSHIGGSNFSIGCKDMSGTISNYDTSLVTQLQNKH